MHSNMATGEEPAGGQSGGAQARGRGSQLGVALRLPAHRAPLPLFVSALAVAAPASAGSSPWELTSLHAPTNVPLRPSVNQVMTVSFHANTGKFLLEFSNEQTGEEGETKYLPFDATAKEVLDALEKLRSGEPKTAIGPGNVVVNGGYDAATETGTYTIEFTGLLGDRYLGEEVLSLSGEITSHEEEKFEKEEEKAGGTREPEEPEGEAEITTPGYHDTVDYQLIPVNRSATPIASPPEHPLTIRREAAGRGDDGGNAARRGAERRTRTAKSGPAGRPPGGLSEKELERRQREEEKHDQELKLPEGAGLSEVECTLVRPRPTPDRCV